jgi:hypothetical protein
MCFKNTDFLIQVTKQSIFNGKCVVRVTHKPSRLSVEDSGYGEINMRDNLIGLLKNILTNASQKEYKQRVDLAKRQDAEFRRLVFSSKQCE